MRVRQSINATEKYCAGCKEIKPLAEFYRKGATGWRHLCKPCFNAEVKARREADPAAHAANVRAWRAANPRGQLNASLRNRFGIGVDDYEVLLAAQGGLCAICRDTDGKTLHVDHDHKTGRIRGLLCGPCNRMLGQGHDSPARLRAGAGYLERTS
jgi:hypothetical protein